jgi:hypothetical protein
MFPDWLKRSDFAVALARKYFQYRSRNLQKVIFTATTGRSGTKSLAKLFSMVPECVAFHEPYPIMNGPVLKAANYGDHATVDRVYRQVKSVNILRSAVGYRYYVESNHLFVKTFFRNAVEEFGARIAVIHLVRSPVEVAMSIYCLDEPSGTENADYWWLDHRAPTNVVQIADALDSDVWSHPFYKALWYWYEVESRFDVWRSKYPALEVVRFETDWINERPRVLRLLEDLGIPSQRVRAESLVSPKTHERAHHKSLAPFPLEEAERMHIQFQTLLAERGVDIARIKWR